MSVKNRTRAIYRRVCSRRKVPGYLDEEGANTVSQTETFVAIRADIDDWRWSGVPFYLRTGKRMPSKCSEVVVYFKQPSLNIFNETYQHLPPNKLTIRLQPDEGIDIEVLNKARGWIINTVCKPPNWI